MPAKKKSGIPLGLRTEHLVWDTPSAVLHMALRLV
jgi:hypothetical protein